MANEFVYEVDGVELDYDHEPTEDEIYADYEGFIANEKKSIPQQEPKQQYVSDEVSLNTPRNSDLPAPASSALGIPQQSITGYPSNETFLNARSNVSDEDLHSPLRVFADNLNPLSDVLFADEHKAKKDATTEWQKITTLAGEGTVLKSKSLAELEGLGVGYEIVKEYDTDMRDVLGVRKNKGLFNELDGNQHKRYDVIIKRTPKEEAILSDFIDRYGYGVEDKNIDIKKLEYSYLQAVLTNEEIIDLKSDNASPKAKIAGEFLGEAALMVAIPMTAEVAAVKIAARAKAVATIMKLGKSKNAAVILEKGNRLKLYKSLIEAYTGSSKAKKTMIQIETVKKLENAGFIAKSIPRAKSGATMGAQIEVVEESVKIGANFFREQPLEYTDAGGFTNEGLKTVLAFAILDPILAPILDPLFKIASKGVETSWRQMKSVMAEHNIKLAENGVTFIKGIGEVPKGDLEIAIKDFVLKYGKLSEKDKHLVSSTQYYINKFGLEQYNNIQKQSLTNLRNVNKQVLAEVESQTVALKILKGEKQARIDKIESKLVKERADLKVSQKQELESAESMTKNFSKKEIDTEVKSNIKANKIDKEEIAKIKLEEKIRGDLYKKDKLVKDAKSKLDTKKKQFKDEEILKQADKDAGIKVADDFPEPINFSDSKILSKATDDIPKLAKDRAKALKIAENETGDLNETKKVYDFYVKNGIDEATARKLTILDGDKNLKITKKQVLDFVKNNKDINMMEMSESKFLKEMYTRDSKLSKNIYAKGVLDTQGKQRVVDEQTMLKLALRSTKSDIEKAQEYMIKNKSLIKETGETTISGKMMEIFDKYNISKTKVDGKKRLVDLPYNEAMAVKADFEGLVKQAEQFNVGFKGFEKNMFQDLEGELLKAMTGKTAFTKEIGGVGQTDSRAFELKLAKSLLNKAKSGSLKPEAIANILAKTEKRGNNSFVKNVVERLINPITRMRDKAYKYSDDLSKIVQEHYGGEYKMDPDHNSKLAFTLEKLDGSIERLTNSDAKGIYALREYGGENHLYSEAFGYKSKSEIDAKLSQWQTDNFNDANFVDDVVEYMSKDIHFDELNATSQYKGGAFLKQEKEYFPFITDKNYKKKLGKTHEKDGESWFRPEDDAGTAIAEGQTKSRTKGAAKRLEINFEQIIDNTINKNLKYNAFKNPVQDLQRLLESPNINKAAIDNGTIEYLESLKTWVRDVVSPTRDKTELSKVLEEFRGMFVRGVLSLNPKVVLRQPGSFVSASVELGAKDVAKSLKGFTKKELEMVAEKDPLMKERFGGHSKELTATEEVAQFLKPTGTGSRVPAINKAGIAVRKAGRVYDNLSKKGMSPIGGFDEFTSKRVWLTRYMKEVNRLTSKGLKPQEIENRAKLSASRFVMMTQPYTSAIGSSGLFRAASKSVVGKVMNTFGSQLNSDFNVFMDNMFLAYSKGEISSYKLTKDLLNLGIAGTLYQDVISSGGARKDSKGNFDLKSTSMAVLKNNIARLPFGAGVDLAQLTSEFHKVFNLKSHRRDLAKQIKTTNEELKQVENNEVVDDKTFEKIKRLRNNVVFLKGKLKVSENDWRADFIKTRTLAQMGSALGVPTGFIGKALKHTEDVFNGKAVFDPMKLAWNDQALNKPLRSYPIVKQQALYELRIDLLDKARNEIGSNPDVMDKIDKKINEYKNTIEELGKDEHK